MEEISLYRKYRPHNFANLVGQEYVKETLVNAFKSGKVSHAYLLAGPRGTGKTSTARLLAKALTCSNLKDNYEPCNECEFCNDINNDSLIDFIEIDAASNRGIDEVRDLKEKIGFAPGRAKFKVYIIDEVHMMTTPAFNALLKTLEEPPEHAYFILATTEIHKIPETIISRCQRFDFRRISEKDLVARLEYIAKEEGIKAEKAALEIIARYVNGGMRDAIGLLEQLSVEGKLLEKTVQDILGMSSNAMLTEFYGALSKNNAKEALTIIHNLHDQGTDLKQFIHEFIDSLRQKMLKMISENKEDGVGRILEMLDILSEAKLKQDIDIPQLPYEVAVLQITGKLVKKAIIEEDEIEEEVTVKAPVQEAKPEKKLEEKEDVASGDFNLKLLKEKWPRVMERIKVPSLRMSLKNALPEKVEGLDVELSFSTNFHKAKVMEHDNRVELEKVIEDVFSKKIKLNARVKEMELKTVMEEDLDRMQSEPKPKPEVEDALDQALNIFGGELVE